MNKALRLLRLARRNRRVLVTAAGVAVLYLALFLFAIGDIGIGSGSFRDAYVVPDAAQRMFERRGPFYFEPIAIVSQPPLALLIAPLNILIGSVLAALVAINIALTLLAWRQPRACARRGGGAGAVAALPGLLAGSACCAPTLLLLLGIQASSLMLSVFSVLIPLAFVLMIVSAVSLARRIDPELVT
jgi:hypothetical protein